MKKSCCKILTGGTTALLAASIALADSGAGLPAILADETTARSHYLPDFSYAGYGNGASDIPATDGTVVNVDDFGAVANDGKDDEEEEEEKRDGHERRQGREHHLADDAQRGEVPEHLEDAEDAERLENFQRPD